MANTLALRRRIKTAQNISKTTRAMQMIAASKLKKAQHAAVTSRPYVDKLMEITQNLAPQKGSTAASDLPIYMQIRSNTKKTLYIIIAPDKGLCGGLITNILREYMKLKGNENSLFVTVGKKVEGPVAASKRLLASFPAGTTLPSFSNVYPIVDIVKEKFVKGEVDEVKIISTHFNSVFSQSPIVTLLLPVQLEVSKDAKETNDSKGAKDTLFEPTQQELLPELLQRYIEMTIFQQMLESYASFQAAQMIAMQNATNNAKDIVNELQLLYNKARQEKITKEILDISSAAVALSEE